MIARLMGLQTFSSAALHERMQMSAGIAGWLDAALPTGSAAQG
jgi:hypothetical protein